MAKQRKLQYPSSPTSFFEEMEQEMNSIKRKKGPKANPVPPEKLFLQFDPNNMEKRICSSEKKISSQLSEIQKTQWKPPIKALCQPERLKSCKVMTLDGSSSVQENNIAKFIKDLAKNSPEKTEKDLDQMKSKNRETAENTMKNDEVITINSLQDSTDQNSPECLPRDIKEITGEMLPLDLHTKTVQVQCERNIAISTPQKADIEGLASGIDCDFAITELDIPDKTSSICQELDDIMSEGKNISNNNKCVLSIDSLDEEKLSPTEQTVPEEMRTDFEKKNNNTLGQTPSSDFIDNNVVEPQRSESQISNNPTNTEILDVFQTMNKSNSNNMEILGVPENNEISVELQVIFENTDCQVKIQTLENSDKSEKININTMSAADTLCATKSLNINYDKGLVLNEINVSNIVEIESAFRDRSPIEINNSRNYEAAQEQEDNNLLNCNDTHNGLMSENVCIIKDIGNESSQLNQNLSEMNCSTVNSTNIAVWEGKSEQGLTIFNNVAAQISDSNSNSSAEDETNANKEEQYLCRDYEVCNNNGTTETNSILIEVDEEDRDKNTNSEFEQLLEVEEEIHKEVDMEEEYPCMMISNSQLLEIEKNYYESSKMTPAKEVSKFPEKESVKSNDSKCKIENSITDSYGNKKGLKLENEISIHTNHTESGIQISSGSNLWKIPQNLPHVKWPQNVLEMKNKIRNLTVEVEQLNAILMRLRQEIWPQRHRDNQSA